MNDWIKKIYFPYIKEAPLCWRGLLILDKASSHIREEIIDKCTGNLMDISILPGGNINIMLLLDISINKKFKSFIREKYIKSILL